MKDAAKDLDEKYWKRFEEKYAPIKVIFEENKIKCPHCKDVKIKDTELDTINNDQEI